MALMTELARTKEQLHRIPTPTPTKSHKPINHGEAAELTCLYAEKAGYNIASEEYGINRSGTQMFGVLRLENKLDRDFTRCIGIRNSHDKTLSFGLTAGVSVMVCSNLCFDGDVVTSRKHTALIDPHVFIPEIFESMGDAHERLEGHIARLKDTVIGDDLARSMVTQAAQIDAIPSCDILPVIKKYMEPPHAEFEPRTEWSLYNSFNEVAKKYSPVRANYTYEKLAEYFNFN
jgi:hypothetical protein